MSSQLAVQSGQSLLSIAKTFAKEANPSASDADIKKLANAIAAANGLSSEAKLKTGPTLTLATPFAPDLRRFHRLRVLYTFP